MASPGSSHNANPLDECQPCDVSEIGYRGAQTGSAGFSADFRLVCEFLVLADAFAHAKRVCLTSSSFQLICKFGSA